jgi:hypothetical protein
MGIILLGFIVLFLHKIGIIILTGAGVIHQVLRVIREIIFCKPKKR